MINKLKKKNNLIIFQKFAILKSSSKILFEINQLKCILFKSCLHGKNKAFQQVSKNKDAKNHF